MRRRFLVSNDQNAVSETQKVLTSRMKKSSQVEDFMTTKDSFIDSNESAYLETERTPVKDDNNISVCDESIYENADGDEENMASSRSILRQESFKDSP